MLPLHCSIFVGGFQCVYKAYRGQISEEKEIVNFFTIPLRIHRRHAIIIPTPSDKQEVHPMKCLIVVDYQVDFVSGTLGNPDAAALDAGIAARIR